MSPTADGLRIVYVGLSDVCEVRIISRRHVVGTEISVKEYEMRKS